MTSEMQRSLYILATLLRDIKFIFSLSIGEILRFIEHRMIGPGFFMRKRQQSDDVYGTVLIIASDSHRKKLISALDVMRTCCPATGAWLESSIGVIGTYNRSSFTGAFLYPGPLLAISGAEIDFDTKGLACVLARRIALARLLRRHFLLSPCAVMRAYVFALSFEERFARDLSVSRKQYEKILLRIEGWQDIHSRWASHPKKSGRWRLFFPV